MSIAEIIEEVERMTSRERQELMKAIEDAERQDHQKQRNIGEKPVVSFAEAAAHLIGSVESKIGDLSTNKKHMEGFGRD